MRSNVSMFMQKIFLIVSFVISGLFFVYYLVSIQSANTKEVHKTQTSSEAAPENNTPRFLQISFPETDFQQADERIARAISGGPSKDGIPALDFPKFESLQDSVIHDEVQAVVLKGEGESEIKVYPYNILTWHEIVNDTIDGRLVSVTFCPLCGSAIVYDRTISGEVTTLGVSGGLIESNMIMYDRATESLWQQSTGKALAGKYFGSTLELVPFQLLPVGEVRRLYPDAQILATDTGYQRDYSHNPYAGYEDTNNQFFFEVSEYSGQFPSKEIMVVFRLGEQVVTTPWLALKDGVTKTVSVNDQTIMLRKQAGELEIMSENGKMLPFYFEMWFSVAVQHDQENLVVVE